ncbi:MAG: hypothetical protein JSV04_00530 [Candidatus Heimdallarchaeota archaeon]|nr:MAG: hypothetical protein JSV04_00530 [Candidatus Heimdallarchaeota archaeon]
MELNKLISKVDNFIQSHGGYWDTAWLLAAITEELGELSRSLQMFAGVRKISPQKYEKSMNLLIEEECGDLFFAMVCLTNSLGINLERALLNTLIKYESR